MLVGGVDAVGAVRQQDAVEAGEAEDVGVAAAADRLAPRLDPGRAQALLGEAERGRAGGHLVAAEELLDPHVDVAAELARAPGAGVGDLPGDLRGAPRVEAARLGVDPAVAGDDVARGAARMIPTFAVVPSSSRPRLIRPIAAAAASIALAPSSGRTPAWASTPTKSARIFCCVGVAVITSPTGPAWSRT